MADRPILGVRKSYIEPLVTDLPVDANDREALRSWVSQLWRARNDWSIRRAGLLAEGRRLGRADADRALRLELAALAAGGDA